MAILPGDGVGPEVIAEARKVLGALGLPLQWTELPWGSSSGATRPTSTCSSAPDIAGRGVANPSGAVWSAALLLEHVGEHDAAAQVMRALEHVCREGPRTRDIGGTAGTAEVGDATAAAVAR